MGVLTESASQIGIPYRRQHLDRALASLTEKQFRAVWACWVEGAELQLCADDECVTDVAILKRLRRARAMIGKYFTQGVSKSASQFGIPNRRQDLGRSALDTRFALCYTSIE